MVLVLVLSCVLAVSADVLHEDIALRICSDSEREFMFGLDDEEVWFADFNKGVGVYPQPDFVDQFRFDEGFYQNAVGQIEVCKNNLVSVRKAMKDEKEKKVAPPIPIVYPKDEVELGQKNFLVCFVGPFYPAPVKISWKKNGENVTAGITHNAPLLNQDATLKQFSKLEFTPQLGDIYSCSVDHVALDQPQTRIYDVKQTGPGVGPAVFCGLGLTVGLLGVAAGTFFLIKGNECS